VEVEHTQNQLQQNGCVYVWLVVVAVAVVQALAALETLGQVVETQPLEHLSLLLQVVQAGLVVAQ
jgi:hypothetical protein